MNRMRLFFILAGLISMAPTYAEIYELPPEGDDVIGAVSTISARQEDTLVDIARRHGLGYEDIVRANPDVNIWLPGEGTEIVLPTRFVLPAGPREGVILNLAEYRLYYFPEPKDGEPASDIDQRICRSQPRSIRDDCCRARRCRNGLLLPKQRPRLSIGKKRAYE